MRFRMEIRRKWFGWKYLKWLVGVRMFIWRSQRRIKQWGDYSVSRNRSPPTAPSHTVFPRTSPALPLLDVFRNLHFTTGFKFLLANFLNKTNGPQWWYLGSEKPNVVLWMCQGWNDPDPWSTFWGLFQNCMTFINLCQLTFFSQVTRFHHGSHDVVNCLQ